MPMIRRSAPFSWYGYLEQHLRFPFAAVCDHVKISSVLKLNQQVQVLELADERKLRARYGCTRSLEKAGPGSSALTAESDGRTRIVDKRLRIGGIGWSVDTSFDRCVGS